jgi:xanthine dehydrogenase accessory factor
MLVYPSERRYEIISGKGVQLIERNHDDGVSTILTKFKNMDIWEQISALRRDGSDFVVVTIIAARGSVPGEVGAKAIVCANGLLTGNLGGGKVEARAISHACEFLTSDAPCQTVTWNLQRDIGMTCGGEMGFLFEKVTAGAAWHIVIFGAGHVSQALVPLLANLSCRIDVIDTRADWLEKLPVRRNVTTRLVSSFEDGVGYITSRSFVLCVTKGHTSDRPVLRDILHAFPTVPYLGVIGSASKRAVLLRELREDGIPGELLEKIICPVGLPIGGNDPEEISISIAAQLLEHRK